jgi:type 1 fimbria pilin
MNDAFSGVADAPYAPATDAVAIQPDDLNPLANIPKGLFVGSGGTITMRGVRGTSDQVWTNVPSGAVLPFRAQYVRATGTTAANLLALY